MLAPGRTTERVARLSTSAGREHSLRMTSRAACRPAPWKYIAGMTSHDVTTSTSKRPSESGLDTSNGLAFVQQRIGLFAKIIALIALAFLILGAVAGLALQLIEPVGPRFRRRPLTGWARSSPTSPASSFSRPCGYCAGGSASP
jgi:hypothetical protein